MVSTEDIWLYHSQIPLDKHPTCKSEELYAIYKLIYLKVIF